MIDYYGSNQEKERKLVIIKAARIGEKPSNDITGIDIWLNWMSSLNNKYGYILVNSINMKHVKLMQDGMCVWCVGLITV